MLYPQTKTRALLETRVFVLGPGHGCLLLGLEGRVLHFIVDWYDSFSLNQIG